MKRRSPEIKKGQEFKTPALIIGALKNQLFFQRSRQGGNKKRSIYENMCAFLFSP
jgi:hypothetical protein